MNTELTVADIAQLTGDPERTVKARVAQWHGRQSDPSVPRVRRAKRSGDARWCLLVDAKSYYERTSAKPLLGSPEAVASGCTCLCGEQDGKRIAIVVEDCPVHATWMAA